MAFEITGHKSGLEGAFVRTQAHTAADALRFAREWSEQGVTGITIVNPQGNCYDIDGFGMIVSSKQEGSDAAPGLRRRSALPMWRGRARVHRSPAKERGAEG